MSDCVVHELTRIDNPVRSKHLVVRCTNPLFDPMDFERYLCTNHDKTPGTRLRFE